MRPLISQSGAPAAAHDPVTGLDRIARRVLAARLAGLRSGRIVLDDGGEPIVLSTGAGSGAGDVRLSIHDPRFYRRVLFGGPIGAAEAYRDGQWSADDLVALIRLLAREVAVTDTLHRGTAGVLGPLRRLGHWLRRNTRAGSRRNIGEHYDLGNDFFREWLDPTMTYSCGIFERPESTMAEASIAKIDRICRKLDLRPGDRVLEIGTGWGSFALHAVRHYGCRVTTTTISREQHGWAERLFREHGVEDRIELRLEDYRDLTGTYDKLVSVEMIEAVGHRNLDAFFGQCAQRLAPDGQMLLQAITIADQRYERAIRSVDFIQRWIFPGSFIPSVTAMTASLTRATDLRLAHLEDLTPHYARTIRAWRERFLERWDAVRALGYPESFLRLWEYYLAYCEGGFEERHIGNVQMLLVKPGCRREPILPALGGGHGGVGP